MATSQDFVNWICSERLDPNFLKYLFIAEDEGLLRFASGSVHQTIYFPEVKAFHICHPPLAEQQRIVGVLDEAFAGLATAQAHAAQNLQNARALFESHLQSVFTHRGKGWVEKRLGDVCERVTVGHVGITSPYYRDEGVLFLRTQNVGKKGLVLDDVKYITPEFHSALKKSAVRPGDILMSRVITHTIHCALIPNDLGPANCANVVLVRPGALVRPRFLIHYIRSPQAQAHLLARKVGSAQLVVNTTVVQNWPIPVPSPAVQEEVISKLDALAAETQRLTRLYEQKQALLSALKKSLLHQAFTGEL